MVEIYSKHNIDFDKLRIRSIPVISLISLDEISKLHSLGDSSRINLGIELGKRLKEIDKSKRVDSVLVELEEVFKEIKSETLLVQNIDILFNPQYKLNILKYFINLARTRMVVIEWPGKTNGNILQYSEVNYDDYTKYNLKDYDVVCIK